MSRSAFERIPMSADAQSEYLSAEVDRMRDFIAGIQGRRRAERQAAAKAPCCAPRNASRSKLDSAKDPGITFEATGIDYLFVDEAHGYKNLRTPSNIPDAAIDGSHARLRPGHEDQLPARAQRQAGGHLRHRHPDRQQHHRGVHHAALPAPRPAGIRRDHRLRHLGRHLRRNRRPDRDGPRRRQQLPAEDPVRPVHQRPRDCCAAGTSPPTSRPPKTSSCPSPPWPRAPPTASAPPRPSSASPATASSTFMAELADRADAIRKRGGRAGRGQHAQGLHRRPQGRPGPAARSGRPMTVPGKIEQPPPTGSRDLWHAHRDDLYPGPDGQRRPGARQPATGVLRHRHPRRRLERLRRTPRPARRPRHAPRADPVRARRAKPTGTRASCSPPAAPGRVAVLIGSTEKMGVGTNVQARAIALHHLDCPWRPADVAQREGRILRQGNHNPEVQILRYVTEGSFDGYMWQTVERKARFIAQVMRGPPGRPRDRGHRRRRPVLQRGQGPGHRQPAAHGQGRSRRRADPARTRRTRLAPQPRRAPPEGHREPPPRRRTGGTHRPDRHRDQPPPQHPRQTRSA